MPTIHRALIFDVETSGLIPKEKDTLLKDKPHILQLSYVVFETNGWTVSKTVNRYINVAPEVEISPLITDLTGITRELCDEGVPIEHALHEFCEDYHRCDMIVAHNISFDRDMMSIELERHSHKFRNELVTSVFHKDCPKDMYCTMHFGRNVCKIERISKHGKTYFKSPKLVELYQHLFGQVPENLHNSLIDTYVCLRCMVKMRFKFDLSLASFPSEMRFT